MTLTDWLSLITICVLGAMSPGPSLAVVLRHSIHSTKHGIMVAMSHGVGVGVYGVDDDDDYDDVVDYDVWWIVYCVWSRGIGDMY